MNGNDGAFPLMVPDSGYQLCLTKREYFAALAMQAILSNSHIDGSYAKSYTNCAVQFADALIAELSKVQT